ncbi:uncharacterized protein LOC126726296 isoform X2 [Quercus robur]|uniref:uncharacterized protein LOC126726296 isoform X2 n=1 Tax=Quercus robur TaxID=38942 RepID=UPI002161A817|nr:uncharacterized protein LOC126726296 isoform X2 [Quercus robur]
MNNILTSPPPYVTLILELIDVKLWRPGRFYSIISIARNRLTASMLRKLLQAACGLDQSWRKAHGKQDKSLLFSTECHTWSLIHIGDLFHVHCLLIKLTSVFCNPFMRYSHLLEPFHKQFVRKIQLMHASRVFVRVRLTSFLGPL